MPNYSYESAMKVLTDADKGRIIACFLAIKDTNAAVDWPKATANYGSASVESMRKMLKGALDKALVSNEDAGTADAPKPAATPKSKGGRKRKADNDGEVADEVTPKSASKKRGKKVKNEPVDEEDEASFDAGDNIVVNTGFRSK